MALQQQLTLT